MTRPDITNDFKARLTARSAPVPLGTFLMSGSPAVSEAMGFCGFDFVIVDMEHVPVEVADLAHLLRAVGVTPTHPVVRIAWNDRVLIKRVLDAGAQTVMVPFVQNVDEAAAAIASVRYPPHGARGAAAIHRASRFGAAADYFAQANDEVCLVVQLETPEAVGRLKEIAGVPGVDAVFVGPGDLSAAMGHIGNIGHDEVQALIRAAAEAAAEAGIPIGIVGPNPAMVRRFLDYGFTFAAVASDVAMMTARAREFLSELSGSAPAKAPAGPY